MKYKADYTVKGELADVLEVSFTGIDAELWHVWELSDSDTKTVGVSVSLPEEAGNEYRNKSASIEFAVEAVQGNAATQDELTASSSESLQTALDRIGNGTISLARDLEISDAASITVPENKEVTIDLAGNKLNIAADGGSAKNGIVVGAGSKLVLSDSASDGENSGIRIVNTNDMGGATKDGHPIFVNGTEEARAELVVENVNIDIDNNEYFSAVLAANYADITLGENASIAMNSNQCAKNFLINNSSVLNIDGAEITVDGISTAVTVGTKGTGSVINFNSGKIVSSNCSNALSVLEVYPGGKLNMTGGVVEVNGNIASSATAIAVVGGGEVAMTGGEIILAPTKGQVQAVMVLNNGRWIGELYTDENGKSLRDYEYYLDVKVTIGGEAKITATTASRSTCYIFGTQSNGVDAYTYVMNGGQAVGIESSELRLVEEGADNYYTIAVESSARITYNGADYYKGSTYYAYKGGSGFSRYTDEVISDSRVQNN